MAEAEKRVPLAFFRRIARVIVCVHEEELFALHGFIKKAQKTPDGDLKLARSRKRQLEKKR